MHTFTRRYSGTAGFVTAIAVTAALLMPVGAAGAVDVEDESGMGIQALPSADPTHFTGLSSDSAAASCWEIKQLHPDSPSGAYWLLTPSMSAPAQFWCDQDTDGGGWVKVGQGREKWETDAAGRGSAAALLDPAPAPDSNTVQLPTTVVDGLLNETSVNALEDGVRVRRARDIDGTLWQEIRFKLSKASGWFWSFGAVWPVTTWRVDSSQGAGGTTSVFGSGSDSTVDTNTLDVQNFTWSFSYGNGVTGSNASSSYLWSATNGAGRARPFGQVYLRPKLLNADLVFPRISDSGTPKAELESVPDANALVNPWGVTGLAGAYEREGDVEVQSMYALGNTMYVGGRFQHVQRDESGSGRVTQPFLAAFDATTGEYIPSFRPSLNEAVLALAPAAGGKLAVGGKFTSVNGTPVTGFAILDPATGALSGPQVTLTNGVTPGVVRVEGISASGGNLYLGGSFTHATGSNNVTRYDRNVVRINATTALPDATWRPEFNGTVTDTDVAADGSKSYFSGFFGKVGADDTPRAAAVPTSGTGVADAWTPTWSSTGNFYQRAITSNGNRIYVGGSEHSMFSFDTSTYERMTTHITNPKGDFQTLQVAGNFLFGGSHSNWFIYEGATRWPSVGTSWNRADPVAWVNAWRLDASSSAVATFTPAIKSRSGAGGWATAVAPDGTVWSGGDFVSGRVQGGRGAWTGAFLRFGYTDGVAPNAPTNLRASSTTGTTANIVWNAPAGGVGSGGSYQIIRDDRVIASTTSTSISVPLSGEQRYFVRAMDKAGNVGASTPVLTIPGGNPAPQAILRHSVDGLDVTFDASGSIDDGSIAAYYWSFGDGAIAEDAVVTHRYIGGGTYRVQLTVIDDKGARGTAAYDLELVQPKPSDPYGAQVSDDQPWAYWRLSETGGPTAADSATGQHRATYQEGVTLGVSGIVDENSAARFDGVDDAVVSSDAISGPNVYSAEAWFKTTTTQGGKIIGFGGSPSGLSNSYDRHVYMQDDGKLVFGIYSGAEYRVATDANYNDGVWHHVVATQSSAGMALYVDGEQIGTNPQSVAENSTGYWRVGGDRTWGSSSPYFKGDIDEAAVYSVALSPAQVLSHYQKGFQLDVPSVEDPYAQTVLEDSPSAYWRLDSAKYGVMADASTHKFNGAIVGAPSFTADSGVSDGHGSMTFDGVDDGVTSARIQPGPTSFATEVWFNTTTTAGGKLVGFGNAKTGGSSNYDRHIYMLEDGRLVAGVWTGQATTVTTSRGYNDGEWHHVVAQLSGSTLSLYVDNVLIGSTALPGGIQAYDGYWRLGGDTSWGGAAYFLGQLDEFAVYADALTPGQIASHYASGTAAANVEPTADFTATASDLTVTVDASASHDTDGAITGYQWDFGDDATAVGVSATHTYASAGTYTVTLTVTDDRGAANSITKTVKATEPPNQLPTPSITAVVDKLEVNVDGSGSSDPDGTIDGYEWDFGDGAKAAGVTASHQYASAGTHTITLTVTDDRGGSSSTTQTVETTEPDNQPPAAVIQVAQSGLSVNVTSAGSSDPDGAIAGYAWDFGDGATATSATASHTYDAGGDYTIALTVTDNRGGTNTATKTVTVAAQQSGEVVPESAAWRYYYSSTPVAAGWKAVSFDDSSWSSGGAPLGYGSTSIVTDLHPSATTADRPRVAYFRTDFTVQEAAKVSALELSTVADDGVVIYVNGVEVGRQGMPAGTVTDQTFASAPPPRTAAANANPLVVQVPVALLVDGKNVISAETHVNYRGTPDVSFKLKATAQTSSVPVNKPPTAAVAASVNGMTVDVDGSGSSDPDGALTAYAWDFGDGASGAGTTASHTYTSAGDYTISLTVTDDDGAVATATKPVSVGTPATSEVVSESSTWKYYYSTTAPDAAWRSTGFDDASWQTGAAPLGYGSALVTTALNVPSDTSARPRAAFFRTAFTIDDAAKVTGLQLASVADDGVVLYVNGVEVARERMPSGTITSDTFASPSPPRTSTANANPVIVSVPVGVLVSGKNVISAETHVNYRGTPDLSFKLSAAMTRSQAGADQMLAPQQAAPEQLDQPAQPEQTDQPGQPEQSEPLAETKQRKVPEALGPLDQVGAPEGADRSAASTPVDEASPLDGLIDVIAPEAPWKYFYGAAGVDEEWASPEFDDSTWGDADGSVGYGTSLAQTELAFEGETRPLTAYLRSAFALEDVSDVSSMELTLLVDDGAVVYVNGVEVARSGMPEGLVTAQTPALAPLTLAADAQPEVISVPMELLVKGKNVVAVELHAAAADSPDLSFSLRAKAIAAH